ncbi:hypothetical protein RHMOL_Rhmol05G0169200 [Rhododendron molle]|uniref:Uncharacterized protein n=1 Tax=Rhododendron molle TaxID=49168 RepID=A0ACC0NR57_RHOML|nr:hypothetical protein RHMOL_Rhmol05G0169200 [Rhododendron molle]
MPEPHSQSSARDRSSSSFGLPQIAHQILLKFPGLAHPIIVISSDSESSGGNSGDLFIREYLERRSRRQASSIASNMSGSSGSNAERDHEYDGSFNTEPDITFTPSTNSDAEHELGPEAESKFRPQAEATTSTGPKPSDTSSENREVADLYERGQVCPHAHYFSG